MRFLDLLRLIGENLNRRKGRVVLTAVGVIIGTAAVVVLVSLAVGLQRSATSQFGSIEEMTQIMVYPFYGDSPEMMVKVAGGGGGGGSQDVSPIQKLLTPSALEEIAALPGIKAVIPRDYMQANAIFRYGRLESWAGITGVGVDDLSVFGYKLLSGTLKLEKGTVIMGQEMLKNFYDPSLRPGQEPPAPPELQDQELRLVLIKYLTDSTGNSIEVKKTLRVRVAGIIGETNSEAAYSVFMSLSELNAINEWALGRRINRSKEGYPMLVVKALDREQVLDLADQITALGFQASTSQSYIEGVNSFFLVLQVIFGGVGAVALLVAAIGIANTMAMAILERTKEIGLMKAVGATNRDVLSIFLGEAAGIGFLGGLGGVILGWGGGKLINILALAYFSSQSSTGGMPSSSISVYTPVWLPVFALVFATLVGIVSGLYPALRAATLVPVNALKYE
jgi:putative ABC transport system permease protein